MSTEHAKPSYQLGTPIIPIADPERKRDLLYSQWLIPQYIAVDNVLLQVGILKFGLPYDLLGVSTAPELLAGGHIDFTDAIDPEASVDALYLFDEQGKKEGFFVSQDTGVWKIIDVTVFSDKFCFEPLIDSNSRLLFLNETIVLPVTVDGDLHDVKFAITGEFNIEMGTIKLLSSAMDVTTAPVARRPELIEKIRKINPLRGYKLGAYRANSSRAPR